MVESSCHGILLGKVPEFICCYFLPKNVAKLTVRFSFQGMYINGIAVYGRDPILTCEYAYFLTIDNSCPYINCYLEALADMEQNPQNATHVVQEMDPVDWRNCSATGYHP